MPHYRPACAIGLIHIDVCNYWFEEHGATCTQLVNVEDATSLIIQIYFRIHNKLICCHTQQSRTELKAAIIEQRHNQYF